MTIYEVLEDIKSKRFKKVIIDSDTACEMDDQFAIAYAFACKNFEILSLNAAPCGVTVIGKDFDQGIVMCYDEIHRVCDKCEVTGKYPIYMGSDNSITDTKGPIDSPAARNIIKTAMEADEMIYIFAIGACTNISSAIMMEPAIKDKICVIYLAGHSLEHGKITEYNWRQDIGASEFLFNCGVLMVQLPCVGGTANMKLTLPTIRKYITGDSKACKFYRDEFPAEFAGNDANEPDGEFMGDHWVRGICDIAAPALFEIPEAFELVVMPTPSWDENYKYVLDESRHLELYMKSYDEDAVIVDALTKINTL